MLDDTHLKQLLLVSNNLTNDNIGDSMMRAMVLKAIMLDPVNKAKADEMVEKSGLMLGLLKLVGKYSNNLLS